MDNLFYNNYSQLQPLAFRLRPKKIEDFVGQENVIGEKSVLRKLLEKNKMINSIFYGPSGVGKTSLAELISLALSAEFISLNATNCSINDIKKIALEAEKRLKINAKQTVVFLDEIHRFNKLQQDSLLPYTENGVITLIGSTTENPYYNLNNALLSRCIVFEFKPLNDSDIEKLVNRASSELELNFDFEIKSYIVALAKGDARVAINYVELVSNLKENITIDELKEILSHRSNIYHKVEDKYNIISAFIKSIRGSAPDAAVYWLGRMLDGGEDPRYIARRLMVHASEDIGMANPEALTIASNAMIASERIGMPEVRIILSHATIYLAISSKSNSVYKAIDNVLTDIESGKIMDVPKHLTKQYSEGYKYPHSYEKNFVIQEYLPEKIKYYIPGNNKNENLINEKLSKLWREEDEH